MNEKEFKDLLNNIEKDFGKETIINYQRNKDRNIEVISSGSLLIDEATGIGGYPRGRILEIYGPESSGKTTLALHAVRAVQKKGEIAAFIDVEHSIDINFAEKLGINLKQLIISQPDSGEQALELVNHLINTGKVALIIIDSVAALTPQEELDGNINDYTMGAQARLMAKSLRKLNASISRTKTIVIFVNQIREKIGTIFGNPEVTPGGRALKFYATLRLDVRIKERLGTNNNLFGQKIKIKIIKNKLSIPYKQVEINLLYESGIDNEEEVIILALKYNLLRQAGSWFYLADKKIAQGRTATINYLKQENLFDEMKKQLQVLIVEALPSAQSH